MSTTPNEANLIRLSPELALYDVVALTEPWPDAGLAKGTWGHVLALPGDGKVDVEFIDRDSEPIAQVIVPETVLELVWTDEV